MSASYMINAIKKFNYSWHTHLVLLVIVFVLLIGVNIANADGETDTPVTENTDVPADNVDTVTAEPITVDASPTEVSETTDQVQGNEETVASQPVDMYSYDSMNRIKSDISVLQSETVKIPQLETEILEIKNNMDSLAKPEKTSAVVETDILKKYAEIIQVACIFLSFVAIILSSFALIKSRNQHLNHTMYTQKAFPQPMLNKNSYGKQQSPANIGLAQVHPDRSNDIKQKIALWKSKGFGDDIIKKELQRFGYKSNEIDMSIK